MVAGSVNSLDGNEVYTYASGQPFSHGGYSYDTWGNNTGIRLLRSRTHGFVSLNAGYVFNVQADQMPQMTTKPVQVPSSIAEPYLLLNIRTSSVGFALVELRPPGSGQPLDGFSFNQSDLIRGNTLSAAASWNHGQAGSLASLRGKLVTVAITMADADLFSIQFGELEPASKLKTDDGSSTMHSLALPPPHADDYYHCLETCSPMSLCKPLKPGPARFEVEVFASAVGGAHEGFAYGQNGSEWRNWLLGAGGSKISHIILMNSQMGVDTGAHDGLLCEAHRRGIRILDGGIVDSCLGASFNSRPDDLLNTTLVDLWVAKSAHFIQSSGLDGAFLDYEGPMYRAMAQSNGSHLREGLTAAMSKLKGAMEAAVPGSQLAMAVGITGEPWNQQFTPEQINSTIHSVDRFFFMDYSFCGHHYSGLANSGLFFIKERLKKMRESLGFPNGQLIAGWPWWGCDFQCHEKDVNCTHLRWDCGGSDCHGREPGGDGHNGSDPGYAQIQPLLSISEARGFGRQWSEEGTSSKDRGGPGPYFTRFNASNGRYYQTWYDP